MDYLQEKELPEKQQRFFGEHPKHSLLGWSQSRQGNLIETKVGGRAFSAIDRFFPCEISGKPVFSGVKLFGFVRNFE